jgi:hypothetical protein
MTSAAYLKMEVQAHSALATTGRIRAALADAGELARMSVYIGFQTFRLWRKMHLVASLTLKPLEPISAEKISDELASHSLVLLREVHEQVLAITQGARRNRFVRVCSGPMLGGIEHDNDILGEFLDDVEMSLSPELRASLQRAIAELKPPTGADWRASLEAMRH